MNYIERNEKRITCLTEFFLLTMNKNGKAQSKYNEKRERQLQRKLNKRIFLFFSFLTKYSSYLNAKLNIFLTYKMFNS